jgi:hypothetical protein
MLLVSTAPLRRRDTLAGYCTAYCTGIPARDLAPGIADRKVKVHACQHPSTALACPVALFQASYNAPPTNSTYENVRVSILA